MRAAIFYDNSLQEKILFIMLQMKEGIEFCYLENIFDDNERHKILRQLFIRNWMTSIMFKLSLGIR